MRTTAMLFCLLVCGCEKDYVEVKCLGTGGDGINCAVEHAKGSSVITACFDFVISCRNAMQATAHTCQNHINPHAVVGVILKDEDFKDAAKCDDVATTTVRNITIAKED